MNQSGELTKRLRHSYTNEQKGGDLAQNPCLSRMSGNPRSKNSSGSRANCEIQNQVWAFGTRPLPTLPASHSLSEAPLAIHEE